MAQTSSPCAPHAFSYKNQWYVVDPAGFLSTPVTPVAGRNLRRKEEDPGTALLPESETALRELKGKGTPAAARRKKDAAPQNEVNGSIVSIDLLVAQQCTMNCVYCYGGGGEYGDPGVMEEETALKTVDWMWRQKGASKSLSINFFGGEPLLRFDLIRKTVSYARALEKGGDVKFNFGLATNASLITEAIIHYLQENGFHINVGFDGPRDIQDRNRQLRNGGSSYDVVVPRIERLIAAMPKNVSLRATLWHKGDVSRVQKTLAGFNPSAYQTQPATPGGHCGKGGGVLPTADSEDTVQGIREVVETFIEAAHTGNLDILASIHKWWNFRWMLMVFQPVRRRPHMCRLGQSIAAVSSSGDIYPCHRYVGWKENRIGSVFEGPLDRAMYCHSTFPECAKCSDCWAREACNGGCLFDNQVRTGDPFNPSDHYCHMIRSLVETAIYLKHALTEAEQTFLRKEKILTPRFCPLDLF